MVALSRVALAALAAAAALSGCSPSKPPVALAAPAGNWIALFNGKDLDGWTPKIAGVDVGDNYRNTFRVEDGLLKVSYQQYDRFDNHFGSLFSNRKLSRYWIRVEYRFVGDEAPGAPSWAYKNSGIQLHSQAPASMRKDQPFPVSVEFDLIGGHALGSRPTGDVCKNGTKVTIDGTPLASQCSKLGTTTVRDDAWVVAEAQVDGARRVRQAINGVEVVEYTDLALDPADADAHRLADASGGVKLDAGYVSLQSNGHPVEFRRIEVLPLDP